MRSGRRSLTFVVLDVDGGVGVEQEAHHVRAARQSRLMQRRHPANTQTKR